VLKRGGLLELTKVVGSESSPPILILTTELRMKRGNVETLSVGK
jgi:hypothetical protein